MGSLTSDYFWRGYSKSDAEPSLQLNFDYSKVSSTHGPYGGVWLSTIQPDEIDASSDARLESIFYIGWSQKLSSNFRADFQFSEYVYDDQLVEGNHYPEHYIFLHYRDLATIDLGYSHDAYGTGGDTLNGSLSLRYPLAQDWDVSGGVGYYRSRSAFGDDYSYWNFGLTRRFSMLSLDLRYIGMGEISFQDDHAAPMVEEESEHDEHRLVLTISMGL